MKLTPEELIRDIYARQLDLDPTIAQMVTRLVEEIDKHSDECECGCE
jgi:hypothetical protein